jgi:hypothetical protein
MKLTSLYLKVEVEHDGEESPERIAGEICRQIRRVYGVRLAELSSYNQVED